MWRILVLLAAIAPSSSFHRMRLEILPTGKPAYRGMAEIVLYCQKDPEGEPHLIIEATEEVMISSAKLYEIEPVSWRQMSPRTNDVIAVRRINASSVSLILKKKCHSNRRYGLFLTFARVASLSFSTGIYTIRDFSDIFSNYKWFWGMHNPTRSAHNMYPVLLDKPHLRMPFQLELYKPHLPSVISHLPERSHHRKLHTFPVAYSIPASLHTFAIVDYTSVTVKIRTGLKLAVWQRREIKPFTTTFFAIIVKAIKGFEDMLAFTYPLPELAILLRNVFPPFGVRFPIGWLGLAIVPEGACSAIGSFIDEERLYRVGSRLSAMIFFGGLVTPITWTNQWLFSGLAGYLEFWGTARLSNKQMDNRFVVGPLQVGLSLDGGSQSIPLIRDESAASKSLDGVNMEKAASLMRMIKYIIGGNKFKLIIIKLLSSYLLHSSNVGSFLALLEQSNAGVGVAFQTWILQRGFPLVTIFRHRRSGKITASQEPWPGLNTTRKDVLWHIPITITNQQAQDWVPSNILWLKKSVDTLDVRAPAPGQWLIANIRQMGFYRVNYDDRNWKKIVSQLNANPNEIHPTNRAQILDDLFELAAINRVSYSWPFLASLYLVRELNYVPLRAFLSQMAHLETLLVTASSQLYSNFRLFCRVVLEPSYTTAVRMSNMNRNDRESNILTELLTAAMCQLDYLPCLDKMIQIFKESMKQKKPNIPSHLRSVAYCTGTRTGKVPGAIAYLEGRLMDEDDPLERIRIIAGLACTSVMNEALRIYKRFISWDDKHESQVYLEYLPKYKTGKSLLMNEIMKHQKLLERFDTISLSRVLWTIGESLHSMTDERKMANLAATSKMYRIQLSLIVKKITANRIWKNTHEKFLREFLVDWRRGRIKAPALKAAPNTNATRMTSQPPQDLLISGEEVDIEEEMANLEKRDFLSLMKDVVEPFVPT